MAAISRPSHPNQNGHCTWPSSRGSRPIHQLLFILSYIVHEIQTMGIGRADFQPRQSPRHCGHCFHCEYAPSHAIISCHQQPPPTQDHLSCTKCKSALRGRAGATDNHTATTNTPHYQRCSTFDRGIPAESTIAPPFLCPDADEVNLGGGSFSLHRFAGVEQLLHP